MWADWEHSPHRHFYVKELAQLDNGRFIVPLRWVTAHKHVHADAYAVQYDKQKKVSLCSCGEMQCAQELTKDNRQKFTINSEIIERIRAKDLLHNVMELREQYGPVIEYDIDSPSWAVNALNPLRHVAQGKPMFTIRLMPWCDDVSGNRSKQYNMHINLYCANLSLPHSKLKQEYFVRFCSTSPHAGSTEQLVPFMNEM
jgi:hypothetical protein